MTIRKLAQSLGPYWLAAAVLPGGLIITPLFFLLRRRNPAVQAAIQRVLVTLLFVAYPAIAGIATDADPRPGATKGSLQQQLFPAANEADEPDVMYLIGSMFDRGEGVPQDYQEALMVRASCGGRSGGGHE